MHNQTDRECDGLTTDFAWTYLQNTTYILLIMSKWLFNLSNRNDDHRSANAIASVSMCWNHYVNGEILTRYIGGEIKNNKDKIISQNPWIVLRWTFSDDYWIKETQHHLKHKRTWQYSFQWTLSRHNRWPYNRTWTRTGREVLFQYEEELNSVQHYCTVL